ncbi:MAG: prepilin-type N-terminal cleavage/methylation domain-containing protein [Verrucomicrobiae bacterium]|nr:prepilin-type N-terminal cleavage/methylation domain-containing protein [Verrucomicrobiae bacterium]NNJ42769.1 prepilin-type N-terminal cleavage/methylation domain-containing protein [Akkermansiaceae bacterium]
MKLTTKKMIKGFTLVELLVVIAIIAALAAMATPVIMKQQKKAAATTAVSNAKQVFLLMVEFDQDFGAFPNEATAASDDDLTAYTGSNSNDFLGQFIAGGYTSSEEIFYAKAGSPTAGNPDNNVESQAETLKAGECGFAYVVNLSTSNNTGLPLLCAPMADETTFKPDPYDGKCVVLRIDGAVKQYRLKKTDATANVGGGKTLFDTDIWTNAQTVTGDAKAPTVVLPK